MPTPEQLPAWVDKVPSLLGGGVLGAIIAAFFKYKADLRGHDVTDGHNTDTHTENLVATLKAFMEAEATRQAERITQLETTASEAAKDYLALQKDFLQLFATHQQCEARIAELNRKVEGLIDGQARAEREHARRERDAEAKIRALEDEKREYVGLNNHLTMTMRAEDIEAKVEANTQKINGTEEKL